MTPKLTASGKNLLLRALAGETITFTKVQLGNGPAQDPTGASGLINPILTVELTRISAGQEYVTLTASFTNGSVESGFHITEAGFYAKDPDNNASEILYAIGNEDESTADYVPDSSSRILEMQFDALIFIGDAENVSAAISSSLVYASKEDFDRHAASKTNPHGVTKLQVGLGNVPNVSTNNQTPTFTEPNTLKNIESGETVSTIFGKIKLAISRLIKHIGDLDNPHECTVLQIGAAAKKHTHNTQDINSGVLPINRGGTGVSSISDLATMLAAAGGFARTRRGSYTGNGLYGPEHTTTISFIWPPRLFVVMPESNTEGGQKGGFIVIRGVMSIYTGGIIDDVEGREYNLRFTWGDNYVSWYSDYDASVQQNESGKTYMFFAIS